MNTQNILSNWQKNLETAHPPIIHFLFWLRIMIYYLTFLLPLFHPACVVSYDIYTLWLYFILIPGEMVIAFYLSPPVLSLKHWLYFAGSIILITVVFISGISMETIKIVFFALFSFLITVLLFKTGKRFIGILALEPFVLGFYYYKLLSYSRASEAIAHTSYRITQILLIITITVFILHAFVLYRTAFYFNRRKKEMLFLLTLIVPLILLFSLFLPPGFVKNSIVLNNLQKEPNPEIIPLPEEGKGQPGGNLRSDLWNRRDDLNQGLDMNGLNGKMMGDLEGIPSNEWRIPQTGRRGTSKQYAVMVLHSKTDPVYTADSYYGEFDSKKGLQVTEDNPLNELKYKRFLESWVQDFKKIPKDKSRYLVPIDYLSTMPERFLAYYPYKIEPTIYTTKFHPFNYEYKTLAYMNKPSPFLWKLIEGLNAEQKKEMASFLEIPLAENDRQVFTSYLDTIIDENTGYYDRIAAILRGYAAFQYELGFDEDTSIAKLSNFVQETRTGDCTEFSHTAAILGRLAGIPSRVLTGFLASKGLQTPVHRRGLAQIMEKIPALQEYDEKNLYLVTTSHRHAWVQFYLPGYGWIDFETTDYAKPPRLTGDPNALDVVIPLIEERQELAKIRTIPLREILIITGVIAVLVICFLYLFYWLKIFWLRLSVIIKKEKALKNLSRLLLIRLMRRGLREKKYSETFLEYAREYPALKEYGKNYNVFSFREKLSKDQKSDLWGKIYSNYRELISVYGYKSFLSFMKSIFSLKGIWI